MAWGLKSLPATAVQRSCRWNSCCACPFAPQRRASVVAGSADVQCLVVPSYAMNLSDFLFCSVSLLRPLLHQLLVGFEGHLIQGLRVSWTHLALRHLDWVRIETASTAVRRKCFVYVQSPPEFLPTCLCRHWEPCLFMLAVPGSGTWERPQAALSALSCRTTRVGSNARFTV